MPRVSRTHLQELVPIAAYLSSADARQSVMSDLISCSQPVWLSALGGHAVFGPVVSSCHCKGKAKGKAKANVKTSVKAKVNTKVKVKTPIQIKLKVKLKFNFKFGIKVKVKTTDSTSKLKVKINTNSVQIPLDIWVAGRIFAFRRTKRLAA